MERDFMGLSVKQETPDEIIDAAAPVRSLPMQWSFSSNGSAHPPQLLSFQTDNPKTGFESLASKKSGYTYPTPAAALPVAVVGTTDLRNSSNISNSPAQLTIFYNGSVCVYHNISPEKAQAIMLLAGNGPHVSCSAPPPVQASTPRASVVLDGYAIRSSPVAQSPAGVVASSPVIADEPLKSIIPLPSVPANFFSSGTVPQFRKKSLARFLKKRKERVITASPYADTAAQIKSHVSAIN
ncbi:hypothetical protein ACS0TY_035110 [Phlomoides rotata]